MRIIRKILSIAAYELTCLLRDKKLTLIFLFSPMLFAVLFGAVYWNKILTEMPIAVLDMDNSSLSRSVVEKYDSNNRFRIVARIDNYDEIEKLLENGKIFMGLVIPEDFSKHVSSGQQSSILTIYDASNLITAFNIRKADIAMASTLDGEIAVKLLAAKGMAVNQAAEIINAVEFRGEAWYNPTANYVSFIYIGIMVMIMHQIPMLAASFAFIREKEEKSYILVHSSGTSIAAQTIGKVLPYVLLGMINYSLLLLFSIFVMGVPLRGSVMLLMLTGILAVLGGIGLGFCSSIVFRNAVQTTMLIMPPSMLLFLASGYAWPWQGIITPINIIMQLIPITPAINIARAVAIKGCTLDTQMLPFIHLSLAALGAWILFFLLVYIKRKPC